MPELRRICFRSRKLPYEGGLLGKVFIFSGKIINFLRKMFNFSGESFNFGI